MYWQYQTILFEFQKDGLLGDKYIDDEEVENLLNEQGQQGWELVNVTPVQEGLLAFLKKERTAVARVISEKKGGLPVPDESSNEKAQPHRESVGVRDGELVRRSARKKDDGIARGDSDLVGGIKIS